MRRYTSATNAFGSMPGQPRVIRQKSYTSDLRPGPQPLTIPVPEVCEL